MKTRKFTCSGETKRMDARLDELALESLEIVKNYLREIDAPMSNSIIIRRALNTFCDTHLRNYDALEKSEVNYYNARFVREMRQAAGR